RSGWPRRSPFWPASSSIFRSRISSSFACPAVCVDEVHLLTASSKFIRHRRDCDNAISGGSASAENVPIGRARCLDVLRKLASICFQRSIFVVKTSVSACPFMSALGAEKILRRPEVGNHVAICISHTGEEQHDRYAALRRTGSAAHALSRVHFSRRPFQLEFMAQGKPEF